MKLLIQNRGVAPEEAFTLIGASGSRNEGGLIGQFGSGAKLAITTLLRKGLDVTVYCGLTRMDFKTKVIEIDDGLSVRQERQVYIQYGGTSKRKQDLGWVLGMGEMDWGVDVKMAIREFVANAIDRTTKQGDKVRDAYVDRDLAIEIVGEGDVRAQKNHTRVFIDADEACQEYVDELAHRFLHFSKVDLSRQILPKIGDRKKAQIYYNGVFVRELEGSPDSLCDYNFTGSQIKIDESRNLDEYQARAAIGKLYRDANVDDLVRMFRALSQGVSCLETTLDSYYIKPIWGEADEKQKQIWRKAWEQVNGDKVACGENQAHAGQMACKKGYGLAVLDETNLDILSAYGVPTVNDVLSHNERKGRVVSPPAFEAIDAVNTVWGWVTGTDLFDEGKCPKPSVRGFDEITNAESDCLGFFDPKTKEVYIRNDVGGEMLLQVALEEVTHYVTGSTDNSRDFQNFLMRVIVKWLR